MNRNSDSASHWEYLDFDLEIGEEREPRKYPVSVRSSEGEAQEEMRFPFDEWELKDKLKDVEVALLRSGGKRRRIGTPEEQAIQGFGRALFEALLVGDVGTHYRVSWREARRQNKGLRIKLRVRPSELSALPWEFLYDPKRDYLSLSSRTPLVRYPEVTQPIERLTVMPPLRILGMVASPQGLPQLDENHEKRLVEEAVRRLQARGLVELTWLEGQTWRDLQRSMRGGPWHIFHFIGHGGFDPETEEGALALSNEEGRTHLLGATDLALLLDDHYFLRLAFLNSCEGAKGSPRDAFSSTAATLVRSGIPAVVAMQYEITDRAAIEFSRSFYEALADGLPVDAVVAEARTAIKMGSALEWGTPVLYMRSEDGLIFDIPPERRHTEPTEATEDVEGQEAPYRQYRESVESAWTRRVLDRRQAERLRDLADELGLSPSTAADIEREVMGDTIQTILERQEEAARGEERSRRLEELYNEASGLHRDRKWQAVIDIFEQIRTEDPAYPDREDLLASAREALEVEKVARRIAATYEQGLRHVDRQEWQQALLCFEETQRLKPGYKDTEMLLSHVRRELTTITVENVSWIRLLRTLKVPDGEAETAGWLRRALQVDQKYSRTNDSVTFSPDGRLLASAVNWSFPELRGRSGTVALWDVEDGTFLRTLGGYGNHVRNVAFSPDGRLLASGLEGGMMQIWQLEDEELLRNVGANRSEGTPTSMAFSPDGRLLASIARLAPQLWRVEDGELLRTLEKQIDQHQVWSYLEGSLAFSLDGRLLAASAGEHTVQVWGVA
jgi:hypothetical protein